MKIKIIFSTGKEIELTPEEVRELMGAKFFYYQPIPYYPAYPISPTWTSSGTQTVEGSSTSSTDNWNRNDE